MAMGTPDLDCIRDSQDQMVIQGVVEAPEEDEIRKIPEMDVSQPVAIEVISEQPPVILQQK